ncbi:MAG: DNA-directed RNA polymerase subunit delta [Mycoplasma sp.]
MSRYEDIAYKLLEREKTPIEFYKLWELVSRELGLPKNSDEINAFYMTLLLDKRFVMRGNNNWGLRKNYKFDDVKMEISSIYDHIDTTTIFEDDLDETIDQNINNVLDDVVVSSSEYDDLDKIDDEDLSDTTASEMLDGFEDNSTTSGEDDE